ncbi:linker histone H1 and H5 family-domain-containing protein [Fimicolochytrium jonesii]|uniref:linker histone H1 and H5 family-domain-containing protein n=1 Tax=Fimicolochytrium jonesii TaxID=1396493 RepID=UPI0022FED5E7|nr:linker histone H1 and H5 family-domain-containing protein [Fimicolochytrium jonesii]KAI8819400.1 linker histone H1 and H5 family-domain-containing protein [Fimicolochytrium jonesii]
MAPTSPAAQKPRKAATAKKASIHPSFKEMVVHAIAELKDRNGSTRQQIRKYIDANYKGLNDSAGRFINQAIKTGVLSGELIQPKGASGPVKLGASAKKATTSTKPKKATSTSAAPKKAATSGTKKRTSSTGTAKKSTGSKVAAKKATTAAKSATKKTVKKSAAAPKKATAPKKRAAPKAAAPVPKKDTGAADKARAARAAKRA